MDDELAMLGEQVARFLGGELVPMAASWEISGAVDAASWRKAAEAGLLCAGIPEAYGGGGGTRAHEAVIHQEMSRAGLGGSFGVANMVSSSIVGHYILAYGTEEQKKRWLPSMARGERIAAIAMTEPGAGSDLQAVRTTGRRVESGFLLNGQKTFISNGQTASLIAVVARTEAGTGARGLSILMVETDGAAGFSRGRKLDKIGMHGQDTSELAFDDVFVPEANLLGEAGGGFTQLMHQLAWERLTIALDAVVNIERAIDLTVAYTRERQAFGKPLFEQQNTQFVLADCKAQALAGRTLVDAMMVRLLAGDLDPATAAAAKLWTTETLSKVADACLQLFGGYGYMTEYPIARLFADARVSRIYGGANEIMKLIVARSL
ncbi:acyl-CoA dehydrogenase family protein [Sphingomonas sp. CGMCC 1.13654]|uniref:Acyl-CoA dehydrogenase family protein n=1 Tax=Sphingomonas chungangi TaxID=2683589 RepID=A0A838L4Z7_9SPHN|nr:acyl-CoA dehydrogenase family protein [Sphingomonas chungangi]MBA2933529.1 acyl-CoA dehydrogenase family protein [Sphingomonas chungangi]MVW54862.1 acyl-CoA dehydrogenase [Sphingomonas chungangi]